PYELADGAGTRYLSVSVHGPSDSTEEFTHGLCHQFGLEDLYLHDNVIGFPEELLPEGWDVMARVGDGMHPLTWSKELATWLTSSGGLVHYIPRPGVGEPSYNGTPVQLHLQSTLEREQVGAIAIGLTDGVSSFEHEDFFFWIEARSPDLGNFDDDTPDKGVIAYTVHKLIDQGQGPVLMRDTDPATSTVEQVIPVGGTATDPLDMGIDVRVISEVLDNGGYMVEVDYDPPEIKYNVKMHIGDPHWTSPDIWIDNQRDGAGFTGYDHVGQRLLADPIDENPIEGEDNRIFARVHNEGPGVARNIRVQYRISAPYHTVGGSADFDYFGHVIISEIPADSHSDVFITWRPEIDDQHNCVVVDLMSLANDSDDSDNHAQQNFTIMESRRSSPYDPVSFTFHLTNPRGEPQLVYLRAEGVPADWHKELNPEKYLLQPKQRITGTLSLTPREGATVCADHHIFVTSWIPSG
ncbi:MAG: hypothetical protein GY832_44550, partial [Chloroflexi bacterium]|nr:hypothetical protein [Chloroflexota bacterium]